MKNRQAYPTQEEIRQLRKAAGWTQQKMADMLNTSKRVVQQWEAAVNDEKNHRYMHPAFFELAQIKAGQHQEFQQIQRNTMNTEQMQVKMSEVAVGDTITSPVFGRVTAVATLKPNTFPADELTQIEFGVGQSPLTGLSRQVVTIEDRRKTK